jgi:hypothetical protein
MKKVFLLMILIMLTGIGTAGCGDESSTDTETDDVATTDAPYSVDIDPADFVAAIENPYLPFKQGSTWVYEGETEDGQERIEVTVTDETRVVMGVECTVVLDQVWLDGELIEDTRDWYAQDKEGNVWYFGEETAEYEDGEIVTTAGAWEAGVDGALPGIVMYAEPTIGETYQQEYYEGEAEDMAKVLSLDETVEIGLGTYENCYQIEEWTPLEPGVTEHKFYAEGIGVILEELVEGGTGRIELIEYQPA